MGVGCDITIAKSVNSAAEVRDVICLRKSCHLLPGFMSIWVEHTHRRYFCSLDPPRLPLLLLELAPRASNRLRPIDTSSLRSRPTCQIPRRLRQAKGREANSSAYATRPIEKMPHSDGKDSALLRLLAVSRVTNGSATPSVGWGLACVSMGRQQLFCD